MSTVSEIARLEKRAKFFQLKRRIASQFNAAGVKEVAKKLFDCEESELLVCCQSCGGHWYVTNHCRSRVCPLCSFRVSKERGKYLKLITKGMKYPKLMTLTMPLWTTDPGEGINFIHSKFNDLKRLRLFKQVIGGAYQIELKKKPGGWHIHIHVLMDCGYLPYQKIWTAWKKIIGHNVPQIDIRCADSDHAKEYVCKYVVKSAGLTGALDDIVAWYFATKGKRLFGTFGKWYNKQIEDLDVENEYPPFICKCPFCSAEHTVFFARDGPFIFGGEEWARISRYYTGDQQTERRLDDVIAWLDQREQ